jgi:asparagine synthase (glutamine-hydrolysing)
VGLAAVVATQLWHHTFCGGGLADLPVWSDSPPTLPRLATSELPEVAIKPPL